MGYGPERDGRERWHIIIHEKRCMMRVYDHVAAYGFEQYTKALGESFQFSIGNVFDIREIEIPRYRDWISVF